MRSVVWAVLMLIAAAAPAHAQIIEIAGSTTVKAYMDRAVTAWLKRHPDMTIRVAGGGSGVGAAAIIGGKASIGMMSREPEPDEMAAIDRQGIRLIRIGFDAVVPVVSDSLFHQAHIHAISHADLAAIYLGRISNWQQLGGPDRHILAVDKEKQSGTREVFMHYLLGDGRAEAPGAMLVVGPNSDVKTVLLASDQAIGFLPFGAVNDSRMHTLALVEPDGSEVVPDAQTIRSGAYPVARSLYLLIRKDAPDYVTALIDFIRSVAGQRLLQAAGYIPLEGQGK